MAKLNVTIPAVDVMVNGVAYRKVDRKAQAGDIVKALCARVDITEGAFYAVYADGDGDPAFRDDGGDERCTFLEYRDRYETFAPVTAEATAATSDVIRHNGATYRKVDRSAHEGDVVVFTETASYVTLGKPYVVDYVDSCGDPQITDDDGDNYDTCGKVFDVYEKVAEGVVQPPVEYREVTRKASVGDRIRIVTPKCARGYGVGDEGLVTESGEGGVFAELPVGSRGVWHNEYVVLEPQPPKYSAGDYVKVTGNSVHHSYAEGSVVKIIRTKDNPCYGGQQFEAEKADGTCGNWLVTNDVELADEAEFLAAKAEIQRKHTLKVGDYAKVTGRGNVHLHIGDIVKLAEAFDEESFKVADVLGAPIPGLKVVSNLTPATPEEVAEAREAAQRKIAVGPFADGGFAQIVNANASNASATPRSTPNAFVKVTLSDGARALRVTYPDGDFGFCNADALHQITEVEYIAATRPKPEFSVGDTVKLTIAGGKSPHYGWGEVKNGDVGKVSAVQPDRVCVDFTKQSGWGAKPGELTKVSAEEAAEAQETAKWAAINRKVGEFKRGDIVSFVKNDGEKGVGTVEDGGSSANCIGVRIGAQPYDGEKYRGVFFDEGDVAALIVPVEQRFDNADKSAA